MLRIIICFLSSIVLLFSCSYEPDEFDYSCTVNKTEYLFDEEIEIQISGGHGKSLINPILVRLSDDGDIVPYDNRDYIQIINESNTPNDHCCASTSNSYSSTNSDDHLANSSSINSGGFICVCNIVGKLKYVAGKKYNEVWQNGSYVGVWEDDDFFDDSQMYDWKVLIVDPFVNENGVRTESTNSNIFPHPNSIITESQIFSITSSTGGGSGGTGGGGSGSSCPSPIPLDLGTASIRIYTDQYPQETTWALYEDGVLILEGGPYSSSGSLQQIEYFVISEDKCYRFDIQDSYGDGILSPGYYEIRDISANLIQSQTGGAFGYEETTYFIGSL